MVLYVFVVAYVGGGDKPRRCGADGSASARSRSCSASRVFVELMIAVLGTSLKALDTRRSPTYRPATARRGRSARCC